MGYTSTVQTDKSAGYIRAAIAGKRVIEASDIKYFSMANYTLGALFPVIETCDNGTIVLRESTAYNSQFVLLQ